MKFLKRCLLWAVLLVGSDSLRAQDTLLLNFSQPAGFYEAPFSVNIACNQSGAAIYYTTNGTPPTSSSARYTGGIRVDSTTVIQAVAYSGGKRSAVAVNTYLIRENTKFPVVSIAIHPDVLFNPVTGMYVLGPRGSRKFPHTGANYYTQREVPCYVEFFETDRQIAFEGYFGLKIFGGMSRIFPQKSFAITAREAYGGPKNIKHQLFPHKDLKKFKNFVLRNSGSDFGETHFRDAFITSLGAEMGLDVQAYRPSIVYLNGRYWGILNIREKLNKFYLQNNFGYDKDSIDLLEHRKNVQAGTRRHYDAMQNYMSNNDLADKKHFDSIARMMDIENFMDYEIVQIYIDNQDAGGNIKFWRPQKAGGRWRWILFDTDFGFGHYGKNGYKQNSLAFHTASNGPAWPNPPWSTFNLRMLLKNKGFRDAFVLRFADRMNTTFEPKHVSARIDSMSNFIKDEIGRHCQRWDLDVARWSRETERMREFAKLRPGYMRQFLREMFPHIGGDVRLRIEIVGGGQVLLNNTVVVSGQVFEGHYFENLPVQLAAKPGFTNQFSHWENMGKRIDEPAFKLNFKDTLQVVKVYFEPGVHPLSKSVIINEISSRDTMGGDWIELYNPSNREVKLKGWTLRDKDGNSFTFPDVVLASDGYLVLCQDVKMFKAKFANVPATALVGDMSFGLDKRQDRIELYDDKGLPVDSVGYQIPKDLKDAIVTLSLTDYDGDNGDANKWHLEDRGGSPASVNPKFVEENKTRQMGALSHYVKVGAISAAIFVVIAAAYVGVRKRLRR